MLLVGVDRSVLGNTMSSVLSTAPRLATFLLDLILMKALQFKCSVGVRLTLRYCLGCNKKLETLPKLAAISERVYCKSLVGKLKTERCIVQLQLFV